MNISYPPDKRTYLWVSEGKKCSFFGKFGVLCFLVTNVLIFAVSPYYTSIMLTFSKKINIRAMRNNFKISVIISFVPNIHGALETIESRKEDYEISDWRAFSSSQLRYDRDNLSHHRFLVLYFLLQCITRNTQCTTINTDMTAIYLIQEKDELSAILLEMTVCQNAWWLWFPF